jgi:membrane-associated phospholipid phosphatase
VLWRRFRHDSRTISPAVWRAWLTALSVGFVLTLVLTIGLVLLGQWLQGHGLQAWDMQTLRWVAAGPLTFANAITWQAPGDLLFQPIFVLAFVAIAIWRSRPLIAASMVATYGLAFAFIWGGWLLWNRSRPDIIAGGIAAPGLHSFPSGHAVLTVAIYGLVAYLWVRASHSWLERTIAIGSASSGPVWSRPRAWRWVRTGPAMCWSDVSLVWHGLWRALSRYSARRV